MDPERDTQGRRAAGARPGDSAWSFHDVAQTLAAQGYLVRTVLLPGHGTKPEDMLDVRLEQWQQVVREQAQLLGREVPKVYLGGFSTGANLVLDYAYGHDEIAGLLLFSPAFRSNSGYAWLTPWIGWARPWLAAPNEGLRPMQTPVRYMNMPTNGFAQFYRSSALAQDRLHQRRYDKPVFIAIAEHDSVLDTDYVLDNFNQRFSNPASRLIWYGDLPARAANTPRVEARKDYLPEYRISRFSHMGLLFQRTIRFTAYRAASVSAGTARARQTPPSAWQASRCGIRTGAIPSRAKSMRG